MKKRSIRTAFVIAASAVCVLLTVLAAAFLILGIRTASIRDGHHALYEDEKYQTPVSIEGIEVITQDVSCGYAVIEMFSAWSGHDVTEESLYAEYGKVTTSTGRAFCAEMNRQFPEYTTRMHRYLTDTELSAAKLSGAFPDGATTADYRNAVNNRYANAGKAMMSAGIVPSASQLEAMGWTPEQYWIYKMSKGGMN